MARNNPKPSEKPDWVPDDTSNIVIPSGGRKTTGWLFEIKPPAENFNWFWNLISRFTDYFSAQIEDWIVIDSDADEGDYSTLAAYIADAPAANDRVLIKEDQTVTVQTIIPANITLKFLDGAELLCATNIATSVLQFGNNVIIEGVLNIILSQTGTTAIAVELDGDNVLGKINVENSSTGTLTTAYHINANNTGNRIEGFAQNTGGGSLTNVIVDNSTEDSNLLIIFHEPTNTIITNGKAFVDLLNNQAIEGVKTFLNEIKADGNLTVGSNSPAAGASNAITVENGSPGAGAPPFASDAIIINSVDSSDGSANATLSLHLEQTVESIGTFTPSHKLKIWINGAEYWIQLDEV